jgi:hypothetical protein
MDAVCLDVIIQQIKSARLVPMFIALSILMTGIRTCWFHQITCAIWSFAVFVMTVGKEKSAVLQGFCYC